MIFDMLIVVNINIAVLRGMYYVTPKRRHISKRVSWGQIPEGSNRQ